MTEPRRPEIRLAFSRVSKALHLLTIPSAPPGESSFKQSSKLALGQTGPLPASRESLMPVYSRP